MRQSENQYDTGRFTEDLRAWGVTLTERQLAQFVRYYEMLAEWNERMNLTAITAYEDVMKKHFLDSLSLTKVLDGKGFPGGKDAGKGCAASLIDVGTGAGFPGLALKSAFPELKVTLLDSLNKRIQFLEAVIGELELEGVRAVHGRAEDFAKPGEMRESFDLCVSRAVARLSTLAEYCLPFVRQGGMFVAYKSEKVSQEMQEAQRAVSLLGGRLEGQTEFMLPNSDIYRNLILIKKVKPSPGKYPRKAGLPGKEPL